MKKSTIILLAVYLCSHISFGQSTEELPTTNKEEELSKKIEELNQLYAILKKQIDSANEQLDNRVQSIDSKFEKLSESINRSYSKIDNRTGSIESKLKISEKEKIRNFTTSVDRNIEIQENFSLYIKFYGDKYSQLDEKVTSEELSLELRRIINPQSGSLGFKLSDTLYNILSKNLSNMVDEVMIDKKDKKDHVKERINNTVNVVTSILDNKVVNDVTGIIPYAYNIKSLIATVSGLVINLFDKKNLKNKYEERLTEKVADYQNKVISDLQPIISFYDNIAKLDNEYQITLQTIRNEVDILGIELREFCLSMEVPLQKIHPTQPIDEDNSLRQITIQMSDLFEELKNDTQINKNNLAMLTNISLEIKNRSRDLYNRYREIQENKINANNEFVKEFGLIVKNSKVSLNTSDLTKTLSNKNIQLLEKMENNHIIDKIEFEKYLNRISELN